GCRCSQCEFHCDSILPPNVTGRFVVSREQFPHPLFVNSQGFEYSRSGNPTRNAFETAVASLENAKYGLAFASGSATTATILNLLDSGAHVISVNDVYGGTYRYFDKVSKVHGVEVDFLDLVDPSLLAKKLRPNTQMIWIETPTNPTLRLVDIKAVAELAK